MRLHRNSTGLITQVDDTVERVLGWTPDQLVGSPSTEFIHPNDQPSAVAAWMEMISDPERPHRWRGRYRTVDDLFSDVVGEDRGALTHAFDEVLQGSSVDDLELRLNVDRDRRVCSLSLRALTDATDDVAGAIGCVLDVTDRVRLRSQLERRATVDALTGCANRSTIIGLLDDLLDAVDLGRRPHRSRRRIHVRGEAGAPRCRCSGRGLTPGPATICLDAWR